MIEQTEVKELEATAVEPEVVDTEASLAIIPETVTQLATRGAEGKAVIEARRQIIDAAIRASIWLTFPEDWVLFKDKNTGRVTAYLQDSGCRRVLPIWGIQATPKGSYDKTEVNGEFAYTLIGDAYCKLTDTWIYNLEGTRTSTEPFAQQVTDPLLKDVRVKQAAKANMEGNAVRRHGGLQNIPERFLTEVWKGTSKSTTQCSLGKGFGSRQDREGTTVRDSSTPDVQPPICELCQKPMKFYAGGSKDGRTWESAWKCQDYKWDMQKRQANGHSKISAADWEKTLASTQQTQESREAGQEG